MPKKLPINPYFNKEKGWFCPFCGKAFRNKKSNLRRHMKSQIFKRLDIDDIKPPKMCLENPKTYTFEQMSAIYKVIDRPPPPPPTKVYIQSYNDIELHDHYLKINWSLDTLQSIVIKLIKNIYLGTDTPENRCIGTNSPYYKIKHKGKWKSQVRCQGKICNLTKSFMCRLLYSKCINYFKNKYPVKFAKLLEICKESKQFNQKYGINPHYKNRAKKEDTDKLFRMFQKKHFNENYKTFKIENEDFRVFSSDTESNYSEMSIQENGKMAQKDINVWYDEWNDIIKTPDFKSFDNDCNQLYIKRDFEKLVYSLLMKNTELADIWISTLHECDDKYIVIDLFENEK